MSKELAQQALAIKALQEYYKPQRESLIEFVKHMWEVYRKGEKLVIPPYYYEIEKKLKEMLDGKCTRLIINVPPRSGKTMMITQFFPIWAMGHVSTREFIATGYSTNLTRGFSQMARDFYRSPEYRKVFPEAPQIRDDQNTNEYWKNEAGGSYYATGTGGSLTGRGCNCFLIDDPIKPDEANKSDVVREGVNTWYLNTVRSRLNDPRTGGIILIQQRTHENDLAGFLIEREAKGGEKWDSIVIPAIEEDWDAQGNRTYKSFFPERFPVDMLLDMRNDDDITFSTQYQQNPVAKESQEFHEEWFQYYDDTPTGGMIFAMLDPANKTKAENDESAIIVGRVVSSKMYIEEILHGRWTQSEVEDKASYVVRKWRPHKFGVEAYAAQVWVGHSLTNKLASDGLYTNIEELTQKGHKEEKIRSIISPFRNGHILFRRGMEGLPELESQLKKFPRGAHDDIVDCLQMLWCLANTQPNIQMEDYKISVNYDQYGRPIYKETTYDII